MAGDDDKKAKKKKVKKTDKAGEDAAPAPESELEPTSTPEPEPEPVAPSEGDEWMVSASEEKTEDGQAPADQEAPATGEQQPEEGMLAEGEEIAELPPAPKKKPKFFIHWDRRKPKFYDYNYDYGQNYYSSIVNYLDHKNLGSTAEIPRRKAFAERGINSSLIRKSHPDLVTQSIMNNVRSSIRGYEHFQKDYAYEVDKKYFV